MLVMAAAWGSAPMQAQTALYPQHFDLSEVTLLDGPFKTAMDKNFQTLLAYDHYRLLTPYIRQAGLSTSDYAGWEASHPSFSNWGSSDFNLDGHVGGHYLSAISLAYAACRDAETKAALKARVDYMVGVMKDCQSAYDSDETGLKGFIGGQPMNAAWQALYSSQATALSGTGNCAVPWYCQHKILAGLRDAYVYAGNTDARDVFLKLCDWCILVTSTLSDAQMETMLNTEHGGVNESLLDAYKLTGEEKYLTAAKRFTHKTMLNGMSTFSSTFLDNKHANTQVPKYIGMERICEEDATATTYQNAAENFWTDVAENRTVCIGGNSVNEAFLASAASNRYIDVLNGPESCNTNNMLKLSEMAFDRTHDAKYADFYEYAMWNHILSTQDPTTGQYVYFTTLRPQGYRIYSTVNESMWCCVGTGMENHSKYGHFIYTHDGTSTLYVNLFTASTLASEDFAITQTTSYPFSDQSTLTVNKAGTYTISIRHPWWTTDGYSISINGNAQSISVTEGTASYVSLNRTWAVGDVITVNVPMELRYTACPNYTDYIAFQYGPILLAAQTSTDDSDEATEKNLTYEASLQNEYGHEGRMDHSPDNRASMKSLTSAPLLIGDRDGESGVLSKITIADLSQLKFTLDASRENAESYTWTSLTLQPFYQIHHARYSCYWYQQTAENFASSTMAAEEAANAAIAERTLDFVATGEQQSEAGHYTVTGGTSTTGVYNNEYYRDARPSDGYIQYTLSYEGEAISSGLSVLCRFTQADAGRKATLYVDGTAIANITSLAAFNGTVVNGFYNVEYPIPDALMRDASGNVKQSFVVRLAADKGTNAPGLYYLRLMKEYDADLPTTVTTTAGDVRTVIDAVVTGENGQSEMSHSFAYSGSNTSSNHGTYQNKYWRDGLAGEYYAYDLATNGETDGVSLVVEYWAGDANRLANIDIDGVTIATQELNSLRSAFLVYEYPVDAALLTGKNKVQVKFTSVGSKYTPGTYNVYLTTGRSTTRTLTPYTFLNTNFEKNGTDGSITAVTYNDDAIQVTSSSGNNYALNMRMKKAVSGTYGLTSDQYLLTIKGQNLGTAAYLWWILGCNHNKKDAPTYTYTDEDDTYLIWDLRKISNFTDAEKNARFIGGGSEVAVSTSNSADYSLMCFGLTSTADDHGATIADISFYSPEQLVNKYSTLKTYFKNIATSLATDSTFVFDGYIYNVADASTVTVEGKYSTQSDYSSVPSTVFGYTVDVPSVNKQIILSNNGDATPLITNANCNNADGWTGSSTVSTWGAQNWRGTGDGSDKYLDVGSLSYVQQTLANMPSGYYKLVAALRCEVAGRITPYLNATNGDTHAGLKYGGAGQSMINTQGVQMPADALQHGYVTNNSSTGWQWGTATAQLTTDGDLTLGFTLSGSGWKCIDDVHLYYSESADGFCTITSTNNSVDASKVLTCDIILTNPNTIVSSDAAVQTASGAQLNNNLVNGTVSNLVLYDGSEFSAVEDFMATAATLYRSIPASSFATICSPFAITGGADGTFYQPTALSEDGVLTFGVQDSPEAGTPYLYKASSAITALTGSGTVKASPVDNGSGVIMKGTLSNIDAVDYDDYVLSGTNLYKVNSAVSLAPFRAYFTISEESSVKANVLSMNFDVAETGINSPGLTPDPSPKDEGSIFNLAGQRVNSPKRGLYIVNGKKVIK